MSVRKKLEIIDPIHIHWPRPICYYPPIWELIIYRDSLKDPRMIELVKEEPHPSPERMAAHYKKRIEITNALIRDNKIDADLGKRAVGHFEAHLKEIEAM